MGAADRRTADARDGPAHLPSVRRLAVAYTALFAGLAAVLAISFSVGSGEGSQAEVAPGEYELRAPPSGCLGERGSDIRIVEAEGAVRIEGADGSGGVLRVEDDRLVGDVICRDASRAALELGLVASRRTADALAGTLGGAALVVQVAGSEAPSAKRSGEETFGRLMLAIAAIIIVARLVGTLLGRLGQPPVMGEILAGILLGPTLLGAIAPEIKDYLFPPDIVPLLSGAAQLGLAFYLFLVGMELDARMLRDRVAQAALISNASVVVPFALGVAVAVPLFDLIEPEKDFGPFALFLGVSMSITAFPVLARLLTERRMLRRPVGALSLASAAIDDVTAWSLLALASAVAGSGSLGHTAQVVALAALFCAAMLVVVRRLVARVSDAYDEAGSIPAIWLGAIFVGVLLSAYVAQQIGIAAIFGAFVMGLIMPRRADLTYDITRRVNDFVVVVLLPLFFVITGLRTDVGKLDAELWLVTLGLIAIAVAGKWLGAMGAARFTGFSRRDSAAIGALMNTRGLTELIVLNIGLELGVITPELFTMLVIMALVTTFMAAPALSLIDPRRELSEPAESEVREAARVEEAPTRSILVAALDEKHVDALLALAEPLARAAPARELILVNLLVPLRVSTGVAIEEQAIERMTHDLAMRRDLLLARGVAARSAAFTSAHRGVDLVKLASEEEVDLVLIDGRRPLLGEGVPRGDVGYLLEHAPCDVGVLVTRGPAPPTVDPEHPVVVPFGGADHDWAALELGAWIAGAQGARLRLLGASGQNGERDVSRLLANASLVVQQLAGVVAEPVFAPPGRHGVIEAARGAGLLVVGLSDRWRREGLGPVRSEIAKQAPAPTLFARRGTRPGALAPREDVTGFTWSSVGQKVVG